MGIFADWELRREHGKVSPCLQTQSSGLGQMMQGLGNLCSSAEANITAVIIHRASEAYPALQRGGGELIRAVRTILVGISCDGEPIPVRWWS